MGEIKTYFFDSYAFYELINGNPNYERFKQGVKIITTKFNLMELHYGLILDYGKEIADKYYDKFIPFSVEIESSIIKSSNEFRSKHKKRKLSYIDCLGYTIARIMDIRFLTGDKEFEDLDNVEFVK